MRAQRVLSSVLSIILFSCASANHADREDLKKRFASLAAQRPQLIWSKTISEKLRKTLADYSGHVKLKSGEVYGSSVHHYQIENKCASDIDWEMKSLSCVRKDDVLKDPRTQTPLLTKDSQTIPLIVYLCGDGGVVRVKPEGDPTSKYKPQPLASKALRYPFDSKFDNFEDEIVKVDHLGNAIPKWTQDLNPNLTKPEEQKDWVQGWADDAHTDLRQDCASSKRK